MSLKLIFFSLGLTAATSAGATQIHCDLSMLYPKTEHYFANKVILTFDDIPGPMRFAIDYETPTRRAHLNGTGTSEGTNGPYGGHFWKFVLPFPNGSGIDYYSIYFAPPTQDVPVSDAIGGVRKSTGQYIMSEMVCQ